MTSQRVPGHTLLFGGQPFNADGQMSDWRKRIGHGKCSCGEMSKRMTSTYQRKAWHRQHKGAVLLEQDLARQAACYLTEENR